MFSTQSHAPELVALGYWRASKDSKEDLPFPSDYVDETWNPAELLFVANYIKRCKPILHWFGFSKCRLCGVRLGASCLSDGVYVFPAQFDHYLLEHDVKPPAEFIAHVLLKKPDA
jgi:hypothetical protein